MSAKSDTSEFRVVGAGSFGAAVREFRRRKGLTQAELASRADMHRSYLSAVERGSATEAMVQLMRAIDALGLEVVVRERR